MYIDTHTHIYGEEFATDIDDAIRRAVDNGCERILLPNIDEASIAQMHSLCERYPSLCTPMMGLHPTEMPTNEGVDSNTISPAVMQLLDRMEALLSAKDAPHCAIGEVGIDLYWDKTRKQEQIAVFEHQIRWAIKYRLPLMIHTRSAHRELVDTLLPFREEVVGGVFHCFSGSEEEATELLKKFPRFVLGIGGVLTFKKCKLPQTLAAVVPLERIVLETDAPYLAPTPHRGERNETSYIPLVIAHLAEIYNTTPENVAKITTNTAKRIFHV